MSNELRGHDIGFQRRRNYQNRLPPFLKGVYSKRKTNVPKRICPTDLLLMQTSFEKGLCLQESKHEFTRAVSLVKKIDNLLSLSKPLTKQEVRDCTSVKVDLMENVYICRGATTSK